ncbi:copper transporter [Sanguibacter suaedae]|uniref:Copper transporter n=1 Tax=Sanguibacter suaedae TaxID=2795737 RepID=A0A934ICR5_9MICO|nr:copper transporter [Sanguibacter suaedae]MBI9116270.1 copper transporter [Sanguibacter suaedae]
MIDFRYHIVSLISVFLALAVGIILGAGPLKESIGDQLTGQVEGLRTEKDQLRAELDAARARLEGTDAFVAGAAPRILDDVLADRRVAVVELGPVDEDVAANIDAQIAAAGGSVTTRVRTTEAWSAQDQADARQSYAASLADYLPAEASAGRYDLTLARGLVASLSDADPADPDALTDDAAVLRDLLVGGELVEVLTAGSVPADVVVVLAPRAESVDGDETPTQEALEQVALVGQDLATAAQEGTEAVVVVGGAPGPGDLVSRVRSDEDLAASIATVTGMGTITGQVNVPLALAVRVAGSVGHFGTGSDATAAIPPVVTLEPVDRTVGTEDAADAPAGGEGTEADG